MGFILSHAQKWHIAPQECIYNTKKLAIREEGQFHFFIMNTLKDYHYICRIIYIMEKRLWASDRRS